MKSALFLRGGWEGHEPKQCAELVCGVLAEEGLKITLSDTLDSLLDAEKLNTYDLIVPVWTMGELTQAQEQNLINAVKKGTGLGGWHGTGDAFRQSTEYQFMTGGQFVSHPGGNIDFEVNITRPEDVIVEGLSDFKVKSEQYYLHVDPSNEALVTTTFSGEFCPWITGCVMPVVWKRTYGEGRVFYSSLGHVAEDFKTPEILEITKRGLLWAAGAL